MTNLTQPSLGERLNRARREPLREADETPEIATALARGKSPATPFLLLGTVALVVFSAVAVVALAALAIWWLV